MKVYYSPFYYADIGEDHVFPIRKFQRVRDRLLAEGTLETGDIVEPRPASLEEVLLVHSEDYVTRLRSGRLTDREIRRLGLPWTKGLVRRSFYAVGGTISAAQAALDEGVASNLAGGTHHAFPDRGEGFCVLNDVAVAIRVLQRKKLAHRFAIVDCDVHQGNGTASIFENDATVFTFSMHGSKNYPLFKMRSSLDIELEDKTGDADYLEALNRGLSAVKEFQPEMVFYLAGADPHVTDKLGRLAVTMPGLKLRDEQMMKFCLSTGIPLVTVMSGGYGKDINDTIEIHCNTIRAVKDIFWNGQVK